MCDLPLTTLALRVDTTCVGLGVQVPGAGGEGGVLGGGTSRKSGRGDGAAGCLPRAGGEYEHVSNADIVCDSLQAPPAVGRSGGCARR